MRQHKPYENLAFLHGKARELALALMDKVKDLLPGMETWFDVFNPVLEVHLGPGVIGFVSVSSW